MGDDAGPQPRSLAGGAIVALVVQALTIGAAIPTSVAIARFEGERGTAAYGLAVNLAGAAFVLFGLGLAFGLSFLVSRREWPARSAVRAGDAVALVSGIVGAAVILAALRLLDAGPLDGISPTMGAAVAVSLPFALAWSYLLAITVSLDRYELFGTVQAAHVLVTLALTVGLLIPFDAEGAVVGYCAGFPIAYLALRVHLARTLPAEGGPAPGGALRVALRFGVRSWGVYLLEFINLRVDLFVLNAFVGRAVVGRYVLAVTITGLAWVLPSALQTVLFPRAASVTDAEETRALMHATLRHGVVLVTASFLVVVALLALVPLVYGDGFAATFRYGLLLLPGALALGFSRLLVAATMSQGFPQYALRSALLAVPPTFALYALLIPPFGAEGAAIASSVSYGIALVLSVRYFRRATGVRVRAAFGSPRSVAADYRAALANLRAYVRRS